MIASTSMNFSNIHYITIHLMFHHNFGKYEPIYKFFTIAFLSKRAIDYNKDCHLTGNALLHYFTNSKMKAI